MTVTASACEGPGSVYQRKQGAMRCSTSGRAQKCERRGRAAAVRRGAASSASAAASASASSGAQRRAGGKGGGEAIDASTGVVHAFSATTEAEESPASVDDFLREARELVDLHGSRVSFPEGRRELGVFCSRALDMQEITTIGACVRACVRVPHEETDRQSRQERGGGETDRQGKAGLLCRLKN